jgi:hypothetical protein
MPTTVADLGERPPREFEGVVGESDRRGDGLDDLRSARMAHPCTDVADLEVMGRKESHHVVEQVAFDHRRHVGRQHQPEPARVHVPTHRAE